VNDAALLWLDDPGATADRVGPKAAVLARLRAAGLPVPDGGCLPAAAYRAHLAAAGLDRPDPDTDGGGRPALRRRLACLRDPLDPAVAGALASAWARLAGDAGALLAVRSSALLEDTARASAAGQFETFLGVAGPGDLETAVRACWASLWSTRALRYLADRGLDPAATAMAVLVQRLVPARAAGGALGRTPEGGMLVTGAWGLGASIAQGEVVPDRFHLDGGGALVRIERGVKDRLVTCEGDAGPRARPVEDALIATPCLLPAEAEALGRLVRAAERLLGTPVEVEWALGDAGLQILQARPLRVEPAPLQVEPPPFQVEPAPLQVGTPPPRAEPTPLQVEPGPLRVDALWSRHPGLTGHPSGLGRGAGRACVVRREGDLERVGLGDVLVTRVAGPALAAVLPRVAAVVAELGGSSSHLAALARERGIPAVLGVRDATRHIPDGAEVAVDGITGIVRWT
jgi:pyruvate,water dikinase